MKMVLRVATITAKDFVEGKNPFKESRKGESFLFCLGSDFWLAKDIVEASAFCRSHGKKAFGFGFHGIFVRRYTAKNVTSYAFWVNNNKRDGNAVEIESGRVVWDWQPAPVEP